MSEELLPGRWVTATIAGKPADVYQPVTWSEPRTAVLYLHGHALITLKDNPVYTAELEQRGWACVCPWGARSWWVDRVCNEFDVELTPWRHLVDNVVPWIDQTWNVSPPGIPLCGVSMGGQGVLRWAYQAASQFPVVAALAPAIDFHEWYGRGLPLDDMYASAEAARQETAILLLNPLNRPRQQLIVCDPEDHEWIGSAEKLVGKLRSSGIPCEADLETRAGGHTWEYFNHMGPRVMQFLADGLASERLRLPVT